MVIPTKTRQAEILEAVLLALRDEAANDGEVINVIVAMTAILSCRTGDTLEQQLTGAALFHEAVRELLRRGYASTH